VPRLLSSSATVPLRGSRACGYTFTWRWLRPTLLVGVGVMGSLWGWYALTGWADPIVVEGHLVEVTQAVLWGLAAATALVSAVRQRMRFDRLLTFWFATLAGLALVRELELHRLLTLLFGVRFKSEWFLNPAPPLWTRLLWIGMGGRRPGCSVPRTSAFRPSSPKGGRDNECRHTPLQP
jgi:hypothetical protein